MNASTGFTRAIAINVCPFFCVNPRFLSQILCSFGEISVFFFSAKLLCEAKFEIETRGEDPGNTATQMFDFLACAVLSVNFKQLLRLLPKLSNL